MRVLHVVPGISLSNGGTASATAQLAHALVNVGVGSTIFATDIATPPQGRKRRFGVSWEEMPEQVENLEVVTFPVQRPKRLLYSPEMGRALASVDGYDVIHIHSLFLYPQYAAAAAARTKQIPYVVTTHGALQPHLRQRGQLRKWLTEYIWQRAMLNGAAALHVTTSEELHQVAELGYRSPLFSLPFGIDPKWFESEGATCFRDRFLEGFDGPLVMFHGRLTAIKGLDLLLDSFSLVRSTIPEARLAIVGPDDEGLRSKLESQASRLGILSGTYFIGALKGDILRSAVRSADVWVMPSYGESFGFAVIEALAAGVPVVVSRHLNIWREIDASGAGLVLDLDPHAFAASMRTMLSSPPHNRRISDLARSFARRYEWPSLAAKFEDLYCSIR